MGSVCGLRLFTKQVSRPADSEDSAVVAAEAEQVERNRRKTWSRARSEFCALQAPAQGRARREGSRGLPASRLSGT
jgi:hypothetical protein